MRQGLSRGGTARLWWLGLLLALCCALWLPGGARGDDGPRPKPGETVPGGGGRTAPGAGNDAGVPGGAGIDAGVPGGAGNDAGVSGVGPGAGLVGDPMAGLAAGDLQAYLRQLNQRMAGYGVEFQLSDFSSLYKPSAGQESQGLVSALLRYLLSEVLANGRLLAQLVMLAVAAALLQTLQSSLAEKGAGSFAYTVVYLALAGAALAGFMLAVAAARTVVHDLTTFLEAALPVLMTLLVGSGAVTSAALLQPVVLLLSGTITAVVSDVVLPLLLLVAALDIVSGFNPEFKLTQLAKLLRQGAITVVSLCFTVFFMVVSVKGFAGAVADSMAVRTTKYLAGAAIPVVGKMFADAAELVVGSATLLRTGMGLVGALAVAFVVAFPLLKILSIMFIYRAAAAVVQPVGGQPVVSCLHTLAGNLGLLLICVALVGLMFFVAVAAIVGAGNMTLMMR
jgi:stage III sporulation protein AE